MMTDVCVCALRSNLRPIGMRSVLLRMPRDETDRESATKHFSNKNCCLWIHIRMERRRRMLLLLTRSVGQRVFQPDRKTDIDSTSQWAMHRCVSSSDHLNLFFFVWFFFCLDGSFSSTVVNVWWKSITALDRCCFSYFLFFQFMSLHQILTSDPLFGTEFSLIFYFLFYFLVCIYLFLLSTVGESRKPKQLVPTIYVVMVRYRKSWMVHVDAIPDFREWGFGRSSQLPVFQDWCFTNVLIRLFCKEFLAVPQHLIFVCGPKKEILNKWLFIHSKNADGY